MCYWDGSTSSKEFFRKKFSVRIEVWNSLNKLIIFEFIIGEKLIMRTKWWKFSGMESSLQNLDQMMEVGFVGTSET